MVLDQDDALPLRKMAITQPPWRHNLDKNMLARTALGVQSVTWGVFAKKRQKVMIKTFKSKHSTILLSPPPLAYPETPQIKLVLWSRDGIKVR